MALYICYMQFRKFYQILKKDTAKAFGCKSVKAATLEGLNCERVSFTLQEMQQILGVDSYAAEILVSEWRDQGHGTFSRVCGLYTFYIKKP